MGKKSKQKTKEKKAVKNVAKKMGKKIGIKDASKIVKKSEKTGIDAGQILQKGLGGLPFIGGLLEETVSQVGMATQPRSSSGGGLRGVQMIDASTGLNLGIISRKRALRMLTRPRSPSRTRRVAIIRSGEQVVKL